ncbi:MAG: flagellar biosynthetic protein FliO [Peptococcaceae bacterium]|jgi:flagellar protein FliO/FliZ|nr:flagellar biosynthetic protein FliO [Peptococcaceae bacterium]
MNEGYSAIGSMIGLFILMILIFVGAYYATKLMGKHYSMQVSSSREMRVIDRLPLGRDRFLLIVEAGDKVLLLGVSPQHIDTLAELDREAFADLPPAQENTDFLSLIKSKLKKTDHHD